MRTTKDAGHPVWHARHGSSIVSPDHQIAGHVSDLWHERSLVAWPRETRQSIPRGHGKKETSCRWQLTRPKPNRIAAKKVETTSLPRNSGNGETRGNFKGFPSREPAEMASSFAWNWSNWLVLFSMRRRRLRGKDAVQLDVWRKWILTKQRC